MPPRRSKIGDARAARAVAFAAPVVVLLYYALRGGSYDSVVWQEEAIAVWWVLGLGAAFGLMPRVSPARAAFVPLAALALLTGLTAAGLVWSDSAERTFTEVARVVHFGGVLLLVLMLVSRVNWRWAAAGLAVAAFLVSGLALVSVLFPSPFPPDVVNQTPGANRLSYPFNYWNAVAAWSAMTLAIALAWSAHAGRALGRAACLAVVPICGVVIYLTYSRGGILSAGLAVLAVLVLSRHRWTVGVHALGAAAATAFAILVTRAHPDVSQGIGAATTPDGAGTVALAVVGAALVSAAVAVAAFAGRTDRLRLSRLRGRVLAAGAAGVAVLAVVLLAGSSISSAWSEFQQPFEPSGTATAEVERRLVSSEGPRADYWRTALDAFEQQPLAGVGPGNYELWWYSSGGAVYVRDAHSLYLEQLAELGVGGLLLAALLTGSLLFLVLRAVRLQRDPASAGALAGLAAAVAVFAFHAGFDWLWETTAVTVLALGAAGTAIGSSGRPAPRPGPPARVALAVIALLAIAVQLPGLASVSSVRDSQTAYRAGDLLGAEAAAEDAVAAQPWAATPFVQRALLAEAAGALSAGRRDALLAIEREPTDWRHRVLLSRIEAKGGDPEAAVGAFREARRLAPGLPILQVSP